MARGVWTELVRSWKVTDRPGSFLRCAIDAFLYRLLRIAPIGEGRLRTIRFRDGGSITYRLNRGDIRAVSETWMNRDYELPFSPEAPRLLVDLGANIGATGCWLARRYGCERVIAVEPDPGNAALARRNFAANGIPAEVHDAAVGPASGTAFFAEARESTLGRLAESGRQIRVLDLPGLIGSDRVDLMKVDSEGAEGELFGTSAAWLAQVRGIIAELHPDYCDSSGVVSVLTEAGFEYRRLASNHPGPKGTEFMAAFWRADAT